MNTSDKLLEEIKKSIDGLLAERRADRVSMLVGQVLLSVVVVALSVIGIVVVVAESQDRQSLEDKLCSEVLETRQVIISILTATMSAAEKGETFTDDRADAQRERLATAIDRLASSNCIGSGSYLE